MKIAIIGAGNVGAMVASRIVEAGLADCVLLDIVPGVAMGKALDISDSRVFYHSDKKIIGTEKYEDIKGSDIVVISAGIARKPGMSRDDLLNKNAETIKVISSQIKKFCPKSIVIVVTNPLDAMTYLVMKETRFQPARVIGMAGALDSARFFNIASDKLADIEEEKIFMLGSHGDSMVAINRSTKLPRDIFEEASKRARDRGAEIVRYLQTGSAYFAPSSAVFHMVKAILKNEDKVICASCYLDGQYGQRDIYIGVPARLCSSGVKEIIEITLTEEEQNTFNKSALEIKESINKLGLTCE